MRDCVNADVSGADATSIKHKSRHNDSLRLSIIFLVHLLLQTTFFYPESLSDLQSLTFILFK